jgi:hypothetical protein
MSDSSGHDSGQPTWRYLTHPLSLAQMQRLKNWHAARPKANPLERQAWEGVVTVWVMAWMGWLPAYTLDAPWAYPLCLLGAWLPQAYVQLRAHAHASGWLRCDWLDLLG